MTQAAADRLLHIAKFVLADENTELDYETSLLLKWAIEDAEKAE